jgi:2,4-dienoyl-CoA reductase-like NADH-dependent reductase (Old Yellow Enzyme family)
MDFQHVLSPTKIGSMEIKNRFVVAPMGMIYANPDGSVSKRLRNYTSLEMV